MSTRSRSKPAVDAAPARSSSLRGQSLPLDAAADALQRGRGDHALGRAADAVQQVDAGLRPRGRDRGRDVAVADQVHARAGLAQLADQLLVALALEHDDADVGHA